MHNIHVIYIDCSGSLRYRPAAYTLFSTIVHEAREFTSYKATVRIVSLNKLNYTCTYCPERRQHINIMTLWCFL